MLEDLHSDDRVQPIIGLVIGISFGFLLQKGSVTRYDVIVGQLLLEDFTVFKMMASAVITGMIGAYILKNVGWTHLRHGIWPSWILSRNHSRSCRSGVDRCPGGWIW